ncbi:MAG: Ig-like domain-containing protein [Myxococcota bacterium]
MRKYFSILYIFSIFSFVIAGCDSGSSGNNATTTNEPSVDFSIIEAGNIFYSTDATELYSNIRVYVRNDEDAPIENLAVTLESANDFVSFDGSAILTDASGIAEFKVVSTELDTATITAHIAEQEGEESLVSISQNILFDLQVDLLTLGEYTYDETGAVADLGIEVADASGLVEGAQITLDGTGDYTVDPQIITTDSSGIAILEFTTESSGIKTITAYLAGIDSPFELITEVTGPTISGSIDCTTSFPTFVNPKATLISVEFESSEILGQIPANSVLTPDNFPQEYSLELPVVPDPALLTHNNRDNSEVGIFPVIVYDDINDNDLLDEDEIIAGAKMTEGIIVFLRGTNNPQTGYNLIETLEESPTLIEWEPNKDQLDFNLWLAPVRTPEISGTVAGPSLENRNMAFFIIDGPYMINNEGTNPFELINNSDHAVKIGDSPVSGNSYSIPATDPLTVMDGTLVEEWTVTHTMEAGQMDQLIVLPVLYQDTNEDDEYDDGDTILGTLTPPFGVEWNFAYILSYPRILSLYLSLQDDLAMHYGFNWRANPLRSSIDSINTGDPMQITIQNELPANKSNKAFAVYDMEVDDSTPIARGTFSTAIMPSGTVTVDDCTGCGDIAVGNTFVITEVYENSTIFDWSEDAVVGPFN